MLTHVCQGMCIPASWTGVSSKRKRWCSGLFPQREQCQWWEYVVEVETEMPSVRSEEKGMCVTCRSLPFEILHAHFIWGGSLEQGTEYRLWFQAF